MISLAEFVRKTPFFVIAHRGASGEAPENTRASIAMAIEGGAKMIEIDIQITKDEELVVFHDSVLGRTTNGSGHIHEKNYEEIKHLDAGSWFHPSFSGETIPRLDEILDLIEGKAYLNLEIKPLKEDYTHAVRGIQQVINVIQEHNLEPFTVYASFDHRALHIVKEIDPNSHTVALNVPGDSRLPSDVVKACGADAFGCSIHELTRTRSKDLKQNLIPWGVYTVNDEAGLEKALDYGAGSVVSNHPGIVWSAYKAKEEGNKS